MIELLMQLGIVSNKKEERWGLVFVCPTYATDTGNLMLRISLIGGVTTCFHFWCVIMGSDCALGC